MTSENSRPLYSHLDRLYEHPWTGVFYVPSIFVWAPNTTHNPWILAFILPELFISKHLPDNGIHLLLNIRTALSLDRHSDDNDVEWQKLLIGRHAHTPDDRIFYMEISNRKFHLNRIVPSKTIRLRNPSIRDLHSIWTPHKYFSKAYFTGNIVLISSSYHFHPLVLCDKCIDACDIPMVDYEVLAQPVEFLHSNHPIAIQ